jgi:FkbM family methyltransferase
MTFRSIAERLALVASLLRSREIALGGARYRIPRGSLNPLRPEEDAQNREPWLDAVLRAAFRCSDGAFLDVGANIGQTLLKVLAIDNSRQYIGFEPQVMCSSVIQKFIQVNRLTKHVVLPIGLSTENRVLKLLMREDEFDAKASIVESFRPQNFYNGYQYVCVRKGDEVATELGLSAIAVMKIDVEGGELEVIEGLAGTIRKYQPFIVFEVLNFYLIVTNESLAEPIVGFRRERIARMEELLRGFGYEIYRIVPGGLTAIANIQPESTPDLTRSNYVAVPRDECDGFVREFHHLIGVA